MRQPGLRHGDLVEIRSPREILSTLDQNGMLDGLPFMPEMVRFCGRRFVVDKRAEKVCDTIYPIASNRLPGTVLLGNLRCSGAEHDGCEADCRLYWKDAWLRQVRPEDPQSPADDAASVSALGERLAANTKLTVNDASAHDVRYRCQATQLSSAGQRLNLWDLNSYWRVYTSGNVHLLRFLKVMARAAMEEPMRKLGITPRVFVSGPGRAQPPGEALNLQPGDLVQVKSKEEIVATLGPDGRNRGLFFDREMLPYCGGTYRVKRRITRFIDDRSGGKMIRLRSDCVTLEGVICSGELSPVRWFCPREIHSFWRETWLRRLPEPGSAAGAPPAPDLASLEHHSGWNQIEETEKADSR